MKIFFTVFVLLAVSSFLDAKKKKKKKNPYDFSSGSVDYYDPSYFGFSSLEQSLDLSMEPKRGRFNFHGYLRQRFALEAARISSRNSMICSPISALIPLGKLSFGATGSTYNELFDAIGVKSKKKVERELRKQIYVIKHLKGVIITVASQIFISHDAIIDSSFEKKAKSVFGTVVEKIDFHKKQEAAEKINRWVSTKTDGMIRSLIGPNEIQSKSSIILANAVYFKGKWKHRFSNLGTGTFYSPTGNVQVPMMTVTNSYRFAKSYSLDAQIIEIPYEQDKVTFIVILPNTRDGLPHLLNTLKLVPDMLNSAMKRMTKHNVQITMPKFKVESKIDLKELYKLVGVKRIFDSHHSELSKIIKGSSVYVSSAIQKAVIEVSEIGTEASAASVNQMVKVSAKIYKNLVIFLADHPFLFFINGKEEQLFAGTFNR